MLIQVHLRTRGGGDLAHEERCGVVAQYEYKLYRCARYELCGLAHEERCGWLSTSFADVRMCGWLTKSSAEWLTKSGLEGLSRERRADRKGSVADDERFGKGSVSRDERFGKATTSA